MADGKVTIDTRIDNSGAISGINNLEKDVKAPLKRIAGLFAVAFSVKAIKGFLDESEKLYETQMTNEIKLETIMRQRMNATDGEIQQIKDLASAQQQIGIIGDEVQLSGAQMIATFLDEKKSLDTLIPAMNDLVTQQYGYNATAESAKSIGTLLGKAMQGQTATLRRVGITFTEAEENVLKYGNETQRASMLAKVITNNVGHMNQALASTPLGQQMQLSNTIGDIKENFGKAYVNIKALFLPALNVLAEVANKVSLAFISLSEAMADTFGINISNSKDLAKNIQSQADSSIELSDGMNDVASSTKKANKQAKAGVRAFDELVNLQTNKDDTSSSGGSSSAAKKTTTNNTNTNDDTKSKASNSMNLIKTLESKIQELKHKIDNLFGSSSLTTSMQGFVKTAEKTLKSLIKSSLSIGKSIGTNFVKGFQDYFDRNKGFISENLTTTFSNLTGIASNFDELYESMADIFTVLETPEAISFTSHFMGIFSNGILGATTLITNFANDLVKMIVKPITRNKGKIKKAFENTFKVLDPIVKTLETAVTETFNKINEDYRMYVKPAFDLMTDAITDIVGALLDAYNDYIAPTLINIGNEANSLYTTYIQPVIDGIIDLISKVVLMLSTFCANVLKPIAVWLINKFAPMISSAINAIWKIVKGLATGIAKIVKDIIDVFKSIVTFLTDVFKGNWDKALGDIKNIGKNIFDFLKGLVDGFVTALQGIADGLGSLFSDAWNGIKSAFDLKTVKSFFGDVWSGIKSVFGNIADWFKDKFSKAWEAVKNVFSAGGKVFSGIKDGILNGLVKVINMLIDGINKIIKVPFDGLNTALQAIKDVSIAGFKPFNFIGTIDVPEIPKIVPGLATGAVLPANKPFLAMVGDQKNGTNIEAPLDTIVQAMKIALGKSNNNSGGDIVINIDGNEVFRVVQNKAEQFSRRTGLNAFGY